MTVWPEIPEKKHLSLPAPGRYEGGAINITLDCDGCKHNFPPDDPRVIEWRERFRKCRGWMRHRASSAFAKHRICTWGKYWQFLYTTDKPRRCGKGFRMGVI
jgi:hypothetical protein